MNRKYIDFVPTRKVEKDVEPKKANTTSAKKQDIDEVEIGEIFAVRENKPRAGVTVSKHPVKKPVTYDGKFVNKGVVNKRPLGDDKDVAAAKARKLTKMPITATKPTPKVAPTPSPAEKKAAETMKVPKANFVNTEKVAKRPLSKNVYQKKIVVPDEEPSGPVTIINKPEKDSRVGLIVTIIITIILGATAGTVAFLLLPK
ncbi:hypothetical protein IJS18_00960 [Candidatus Saccharibacteria bacterium]|nr:hypothetical protein [Candidatus Saccharibacteria bacterium]